MMRSITGTRFIPDPYVVGAVAMSINSGAYCTELIRSGIMGVDKGQWEACKVLGLNYSQLKLLVILKDSTSFLCCRVLRVESWWLIFYESILKSFKMS